MRALVLGCGPAGLMSAHAFAMTGHDVLIVSRKRRSEMYGAQYLHSPIPGMTPTPPVTVNYRLDGTVDQYRKKVYGNESRIEVSPESLTGKHDGWDIRATYLELWDTYSEYVQDIEIDPVSFKGLQKDLNPDVVVSTVPRPLLCYDDSHTFSGQHVWAIGDAPERGVFSPVKMAKNTVVCNGEPSPGWYRASTVFGYSTVEWPFHPRPPFAGVSEIVKPLHHTCNCYGEDVFHFGRFGRWSKGALSHEAFQGSLEIARGAGVQGSLIL